MEQKLKVNVTFPLEVPVLTDIAGRRRSIPDQVARFIDDFMHDMRISMMNGGRGAQDWKSPGPSEENMEIYEKITSKETGKRLAEGERLAEEHRIRFDKFKDKECRELYDMPWKEFRLLKGGEQGDLRKRLGVIWEGGKFVKGDVKKNDKECLDLYGCSWCNFRMLSTQEQAEMRQKHNVIHEGGKWTKREN